MSSPTVEAQAPVAGPSPKQGRPIPQAVFWAVVVLGTIASGYYLKQVVEQGKDMLHMVDLSAYQVAAERIVNGTSVYDSPLFGSTRGVFEFVYTPFSALTFVPLAMLHGDLFTIVGAVGNILVLIGSAWVTLARLGYRRDARLALFSVLVAGMLLWCEPVRETVAFGQINLVLMALVLVDLALPDSVRWKGALTGIAAGIKLTPAFFVLYLLATKRFRAVAVAGCSFAATVVVGFVLMPKDSMTFWSGAFMDPTRVGVPEHPGNQTLRGMIARTMGLEGASMLLWAALAAAVAVGCLLLARHLSLRGHEMLAVALCGLTSTFVSPYSWVHHWVWFAPLLICLLHLSTNAGAVAARLGLAVAWAITLGGVIELFVPDVSSVLSFPDWHGIEILYHNAYIWLTLALFVGVFLKLRRPSSPSPELERLPASQT